MNATPFDLQNKTGPSKNDLKMKKLRVFEQDRIIFLFFLQIHRFIYHLPSEGEVRKQGGMPVVANRELLGIPPIV